MRLDFCCCCGSPDNLEHHRLVAGIDDETNLITLCRACFGKARGAKASDPRASEKSKMPPPIMYENDDAAAWRRADADYWTERFLGSGYTADLTAWLKE
jgi:hypothetical protein